MPKRHTTVNLDEKLLEEAMKALGTTQVTETIHKAFAEVIRDWHVRRLMEMDLPDLTPEMLEKIRAPRNFDPALQRLPETA